MSTSSWSAEVAVLVMLEPFHWLPTAVAVVEALSSKLFIYSLAPIPLLSELVGPLVARGALPASAIQLVS
jgi:hypothetical protein